MRTKFFFQSNKTEKQKKTLNENPTYIPPFSSLGLFPDKQKSQQATWLSDLTISNTDPK